MQSWPGRPGRAEKHSGILEKAIRLVHLFPWRAPLSRISRILSAAQAGAPAPCSQVEQEAGLL
jgi:hypothetical protein